MDEIRNLAIEQIATGMPGGFFIYHADGDEEVIYANNELLYLYGCRTLEEFRALTGNSFKGMVHPDDLDEVEESITRQIAESQRHMDYVEYRIVRKDGEVRYVEDFGHLLKSDVYGDVFYVFVSDVTEKRARHIEREQQYVEMLAEQEEIKRALKFALQVYREIYLVNLETDHMKRVYPEDAEGKTTGSYRGIIEQRILDGIISSEHEEDVEKLLQPESLKEALMNEESVEYRYSRKKEDADDEEDMMERCSTLIAVTRRVEGVPAAVVVGVRSIENIVQREERQNMILEGALMHAEQANEAKTTFLANMSHDIRTPLNAIMGFTDLAMGHLYDREKLVHCLEKINSSSHTLLELIDDILDMSRIESGKIEFAKAECSLEGLMNSIWHNLEKQIFDKGLHYNVNMEKVKNPNIICDELRLGQILINVIGNAVKYTENEGSISVEIEQTGSLGPGVSYYEFRVRDTGVGISPDFVAKIFTPFEREKTSTVSKISGTGLGLAITKNLVDLMNGTIKVHSRVGQGTEFIIRLPFQTVKNKKEHARPESNTREIIKEEQQYLKGKRILLVEDNELNREIAKTLFEESGMVVSEAEDGDVAVAMVQMADEPYDCVVMDIQMPNMNGYDATRAIRALKDPGISRVPIIGMSANAFEEDKRKSMEAGMNAHVAKPIDMDVVIETLKLFL